MWDELVAPLLITPWGRKAGLGVMMTMAVLIFFTFIMMIVNLRSDIKLSFATTKTRPVESTNETAKLIAQIPQRHLFGKYGIVEESSLLPVTSLQIHLVGVIKATPEKFSKVIISESSQPAKVYQVGDKLPSTGVKIYAITSDGVILDNSGRMEKLPLQRTQLEFQGMPKPLMGE
jgi:type II secretion system protein C